MDKGWQTWSTRAAELLLLCVDRQNRKAQVQGFFKMTDEAATVIQEDISKDLYEMAACHKEEVIGSCRNLTTMMLIPLST